MKGKKIVLASNSPRRLEILKTYVCNLAVLFEQDCLHVVGNRATCVSIDIPRESL